MSDYTDYERDIVLSAFVSGWVRPMVQQLVLLLWVENVVVDYVWLCVSCCDYVEIHAVCIDEDNSLVECVAVWEYDDGVVIGPLTFPWNLADVELGDLPEGL